MTLATVADAQTRFRFHRNSDDSILFEDDKHGSRLVMPADYYAANRVAAEHYGIVNPGTVTHFGEQGLTVNFNAPMRHTLTENELAHWLDVECFATNEEWWWRDLLQIRYRALENRARAANGGNQ